MLKAIFDWFCDHQFSDYMKNRRITGTMKRTLPNGQQVEFVEYQGDPKELVGQYIYGRIIVSDYIFNNFSENTQDVVVAHEYGHKRTHPIVAIPTILLMIICGLGGLFSIFIGIPLGGVMAFLHRISIFGFAIFTAGFLIWGAIFLLGFIAASWVSEGYAELYAINAVGVENYKLHLKEREEKKHLRRKSTFETFRSAISYPPLSWTLWVYFKLPKKVSRWLGVYP